MILLVAGLLLWAGAHWLKRLAPEARARMGEPGKGLVTMLLVAALAMMIFGYRWADWVTVWTPPAFMIHINNLLMLLAFFLIGLSQTKGKLRGAMRHPQLTAVKTWAVAHLLVNGDLASVILFGGMLAWAVVSVILINRAEPDWQRPAPGTASKDILLVVITLVSFGLVAGIHIWLGVWPFPS